MKVQKVYNELIKNHLKFKKPGVAAKYKGGVIISPDEYRAFIIPENDFILDFDKLLGAAVQTKLVAENIIKSSENPNYRDGKLLEKYEVKGDAVGKNKRMIQAIQSGDETVWVNKKYLDYFDKPKLRTLGYKDPIFVYEEDKLVGLVLPVVNK